MINDVIRIAKSAGEKVMAIYNDGNLEIEYKNDSENSPLTKADLAADREILLGLQKLSKFPVVSEESYVEYEKRKNWKIFWLVDPLDGTKDFIAKNGEFTINIALINGNSSVLGVVYAPALNLMYWAEKGKGAFLNGKRIYNDSKRTDLIGSDSRFHSTKETLAFLEKHNIKEIKRFGSALKICKLAEGEIDVYPRLNGTSEWDTAAAHIIANEAGCKLVDVVTGQELIYNKENIKNNHFVSSRKDLVFKLN